MSARGGVLFGGLVLTILGIACQARLSAQPCDAVDKEALTGGTRSGRHRDLHDSSTYSRVTPSDMLALRKSMSSVASGRRRRRTSSK